MPETIYLGAIFEVILMLSTKKNCEITNDHYCKTSKTNGCCNYRTDEKRFYKFWHICNFLLLEIIEHVMLKNNKCLKGISKQYYKYQILIAISLNFIPIKSQ